MGDGIAQAELGDPTADRGEVAAAAGPESGDVYRRALDAAHRHASRWLESVGERPVRPEADVDGILARLRLDLPDVGEDAEAVVEELVEASAPGLMAMGSPRFYGFVIGMGHCRAQPSSRTSTSGSTQNQGSAHTLIASNDQSFAILAFVSTSLTWRQ